MTDRNYMKLIIGNLKMNLVSLQEREEYLKMFKKDIDYLNVKQNKIHNSSKISKYRLLFNSE